MYKSITTSLLAGAFALTATNLHAAGVDRTVQSMAILFQKGNYVEFGMTHSVPNVSGRTSAALGNARIRNIARPVTSGTLAFKSDINDNWSYAVILDQPIGADVLYPSGSLLRGSKARLDSTQLTGILRYNFGNGFSAYGGLRSVWTSGRVTLGPNLPVPALGGAPFNYRMTTNTDQAFGYLVGVAYEQPEIALRVALTYHSEIRHRFKAKESATATPFLNAGATTLRTRFNTTIPESLNLEFQTGVAEGTLVFGSIRWTNWRKFQIAPSHFTAAAAQGGLGQPALVKYRRNTMTYTLGVGRRFNENWSGSVSVSHGTGNGNPTGNLGPVGARTSLGLGVSYTQDKMTISAGVQYVTLGNARTRTDNRFRRNSAVGGGIRVGFGF